MLYPAYSLYVMGGLRAFLLLPMLGGVLAELAALALARSGGRGDGWLAFWAIGLSTPLLVYALDFWEHTLGAAAMLWAVVLLVDVVRGDRAWRGALAAGALFGLAATMRTEALIYGFVAVATAGVMLCREHTDRRRI